MNDEDSSSRKVQDLSFFESFVILIKNINSIDFEWSEATDSIIDATKIIPNLDTFEKCIFWDLKEHINDKTEYIPCKYCNGIILDPTSTQVANHRKGTGSLHDHCKYDHKKHQASLRKKKERDKKRSF